MTMSEGRSRVRTAERLGSSQPAERVSFTAEGATMTAAQSYPKMTQVGRPVQRHSVEPELRARFEDEAAPLRDLLYRHACRMTRNRANAEDLVQETMMKAYKGFHSFQRGGHRAAFDGYLHPLRAGGIAFSRRPGAKFVVGQRPKVGNASAAAAISRRGVLR